ncbi:MAG: hypothetical protein JWN46_3679 [Acidimicrobiales bacterium]|nr:hypothetical protein [Acidimicrobiales bacterium]
MPDLFTYGVASGDPLPDRVLLWTHVSVPDGVPVPVEWCVARNPLLTDVVARGTVVATAEHDHTVHVDPSGLAPATTYYFAFEARGVASALGRTRTLPTGLVDRARFAVTSCAKFNAGYFNAYDRIADRADQGDVDFLLHLGDYIYGAANTPPAGQTPGAEIGRPFDPLDACVTLDDYRTRYRQYAADPALRRLRASLPTIAGLDDQELADGAWSGGADDHDEAVHGPWSARLAAAFRAREEWLPVRRPDPSDPSRVFRAIPLGDLADIVLTDARSRRDQPLPGAAMLDQGRSALGHQQRAWLLDAFSSSTAAWRVWANPSVLSTTYRADVPEPLRTALLELKLTAPDGSQCDPDRWDGFAPERDAILRHLEEGVVADVVVLSGDIHVGLAAEVHRDPFTAGTAEPLAVEMATASVTSQNLDDKLGYAYGGSAAAQAQLLEALPHAQWADFDGHGYLLVDVDHDRLRGEWWFVDDVLTPSGGEFCANAYEVERGLARLLPAMTTPG